MKLSFLKYLLIIPILLCGYQEIQAQRKQDVVYLKNGGVRRGKIVPNEEAKPGLNVTRIKTRDGNIFVYQKDQVEKITNEAFYRRTVPLKEKGLFATIHTGLQISRGYWGGLRSNGILKATIGKQFNHKHSLGLGIEITELRYYNVIPLFLETRYNLIPGKRTTPFLKVLGGYSTPIFNQKINGKWENQGGFVAGSSIGLRHNFSSSTALDISLGYRFQKVTRNERIWDWWNWEGEVISSKVINHYKRLSLEVGFYFN